MLTSLGLKALSFEALPDEVSDHLAIEATLTGAV
jgi:hypothetical protein